MVISIFPLISNVACFCFVLIVITVCHAELNAIMNKNSADVKGCTMYVALFPCNECAKLIIQAGGCLQVPDNGFSIYCGATLQLNVAVRLFLVTPLSSLFSRSERGDLPLR